MDAYVIDSAVLQKNIAICRREMAGRQLYAVVKGDGYGLGLEDYARFLLQEGIEAFAVTETAAAESLRALGFGGDILMLRVVSDSGELEELLGLNVIFSVGSLRSLSALEEAARKRGLVARAHIYIDSGMGREGFSNRDKGCLQDLCRRHTAVELCGAYTHFPCAGGCPGDTRRRFEAFMQTVQAMKSVGWSGQIHCAGSCAALRFPDMRLDAVRLGSAFLGRVDWCGAKNLGLRPVGYIDACIAAIHEVQPGQTLGYAGAFRARRKTRVAVLEVGYYNGYDTERCRDLFCLRDYVRAMLSPLKTLLGLRRRTGLIRGREAEVLGKVAMQNTLLDVTDCPCEVGERAILPCSPLLVRNLPRYFL